MKIGILFSGGKDSNYTTYLLSKEFEVVCLINMKSENNYSYMFQSLGNEFLDMQSKALNIPLLKVNTSGEKEKELEDLEKAIRLVKEKYNIEGVGTGAIKSAYQSSRIQKICNKLGLWCFNPLWQKNEEEFMKELIDNKFEVIIAGVFSYPLSKKDIGKTIDYKFLDELTKKNDYINCAGEGGEYESFVLNGPMFKKKIIIEDYEVNMEGENCGYMKIEEVKLEDK